MSLNVTHLSVIEGDARIADSHLQQVLEYGRINDLHRIIKTHEAELETYGGLFCRTGKIIGRGRPTQTYYLTEAQATLVCMFARTPKAALARKLIIDVFTAWRRGEALSSIVAQPDPFAANAARVGHVANHLEHLNGIPDLVLQVTHLPIWKNGRRPAWWHEIDVRTFLTTAHRQMSLLEAERIGGQRFGPRCPRKSAIHIYWQRLDGVLGPIRLGPTPAPLARISA